MESIFSTRGMRSPVTSARIGDPVYQAYRILQLSFIVAPLVAGFDKFFNVLTDWDRYLAPIVIDLVSEFSFMTFIGVVEIVVAIGIAMGPRIFAYIVAAWMGGIILNLLLIPGYYDIALHDIGLALGALALSRLSHQFI